MESLMAEATLPPVRTFYIQISKFEADITKAHLYQCKIKMCLIFAGDQEDWH